jgi:aminoglycoside phosphotransferase (APT) family kinase protein
MTVMDTAACRQPSAEALRTLIAEGPAIEAAMRLLSCGKLTRLKVERMHFPGAKPVQMQIRAWDNSGHSRILLGEWVGPEAAERAAAEAARLAKPRRGMAPPPGASAVVADPAHGLLLRRPGFDAKLPGMRLLHDVEWAPSQLAALGCDPGASISLVAHRLGKRAVLRIDGPGGTYYARLRPVTSNSGQEAYERHLSLWQALEGCPHLAIPRPLGFDAELGLALFDALPGTPPQFLGLPGFRATQAVMRGLASLQGLPIEAPLHGVIDELGILDTWVARVADVFPDLAIQLRAPLARLQDDMAALCALPPVPCHRDLHEGQILLDNGRAGLLDFDTLRCGDPTLDVGNLQAHLLLATHRDGRSRRAFVAAMETALPDLSLRRIAVWRRAALLRLAMIYAFTAEPRNVIRSLIDEAA